MGKKMSKDDFILKSSILHKYKFDYSLVEYKNNKTKVSIICPIHGIFEQAPIYHLNMSCGCKFCYGRVNINKEEFIKKSISIHGYKYDYSEVEYINANSKIKILCKLHGPFKQRASTHMSGSGCIKCGNESKKIDYMVELQKKYDGKYDYSLATYKNCDSKIKIICRQHGLFEKKISKHLAGDECPSCLGRVCDLNSFINVANAVHKNKYDYSKVVYTKSNQSIDVICPYHGLFSQRAYSHIDGYGCESCSESKGELAVAKVLDILNIKYIRQHKFANCVYKNKLVFDFYLPKYNTCIEYNGKQHYIPVEFFGGEETFKLNILRDTIKHRYCEDTNTKLVVIKYDDVIDENFLYSRLLN